MPNTLLEAQDLAFSYGDRPVLRGASIALSSGEVVALLGPNGSGKSTLLRVLLGQLRGTGAIHWNGRPLVQWKRRELAHLVAYLPQNPTGEPEQTVADVLRLGRSPYLQAFGLESDQDVRVVQSVAQTLALSDLLNRRLDALSGGQRQRVFLGRCLVQEPRALLLDEPNTFLDLRHQVEMGQLLRQLTRDKGMAVLMASHDLNLAGQFADRLVLICDGEIMAHGTPGEVLEPELLARVYKLPMRRVEHEGSVYVFPALQ